MVPGRSKSKAKSETGGRRPTTPFGRIDAFLAKLEQKATDSGLKRIRVPLYLLRVFFQVVRQWMRDRCPQQAASLAFQTVLSIVPILAVATAALRALGHFRAESSFVNFIADYLIPVSREEISEKLRTFSQNITFESVGLVGLITFVLLAFVMFNNLERIVNQIWRAERRRSVTQKFVVFYFAMTVGPFLVGASLVEAARFGLTSGISGIFFGLASTFAVLFLANLFIPVPKVRLVPALVGAVLTTFLFEIAKLAFSTYVTNYALSKYAGVYGAVAIVPIWLIWIYYSWLTLLLGIEVAHAVQNLSVLEGIARHSPLTLQGELLRRVNPMTAARIMGAIARVYESDEKAISRRGLCQQFDLSEEALEHIVSRLIEADLVMEVEGKRPGLAPARPPEHIALASVFELFDDDTVESARAGDTPSQLDRTLAELAAHTREVGAITFAELVE